LVANLSFRSQGEVKGATDFAIIEESIRKEIKSKNQQEKVTKSSSEQKKSNVMSEDKVVMILKHIQQSNAFHVQYSPNFH